MRDPPQPPVLPDPAGAVTLTERRAQAAMAVLGLLSGLPYGLFGPGIVLDDQYTLAWAWQLGRWQAAGPTQWRARPLGALLYDVQFGLVGPHPLAWWAGQLAVTMVTAALLVALLRRVAPLAVATATTAVWVISANHSTLDHWGSGSLAGASLLLLLAGSVLLARAAEAGTAPWMGVALLAAAPLVYEATLPPALLAAAALPRLLGHPDRLAAAARRGLPFVGVGAWLVAGSYHLRHDQGWFGFASVPDALFGQGIARWPGPSTVLLGTGVVGVTLVLLRPVAPSLRRAIPPEPARLVRAGLVVVAAGYAAFVRYPINPLGVGDRANVVSAIGGAMVWTGLGWSLARHRRVLVPATVAFAVLLGAGRVARAADWANAGRDTEAVRAAVVPAFDRVPAGTLLVVGPPPAGHQGIFGMLGTIDPLVQLARRDPGVRATVVVHAHEWAQVPPERRVVLP